MIKVSSVDGYGGWMHTYATRDLQDAQREINQAVDMDAGNARRDPNSFAIRNVKELQQRPRRLLHKWVYFTAEYILTRWGAALSLVHAGSCIRHSALVILSERTGAQGLES